MYCSKRSKGTYVETGFTRLQREIILNRIEHDNCQALRKPNLQYVIRFYVRSTTKAPEVAKGHQKSRFLKMMLAITPERSKTQQ